ncbi:pancreatic triacylglycerol lipase-like isoform X3 [Vespula pensylvanica]|uniref:pancreatic triacylglycerol lipase-like isoform X3 n=1 Tax=Vespula pensylvanica TaxID=30213 RepID=UPI001CBA12E4|nr:pancreatic triacylglycerol lipase-like isoform X3 [Vespula pensylvanica]
MSFIARFVFLLTFLNLSKSSTNDMQHRLTADKSQGFFLGEVLLDALVNPMGTAQNDRSVINNIFDPNLIAEDVTFELYTRNNPVQAYFLKVDDIIGLKESPFESENPTKILIHGWTDSANTYWLQDFRQNYLTVGNYNVISVNWFPASLKEYWIAAKLTRQVGKYIAEMLNFLVSQTDLSLDDIHILGHSLGAHVAGFAGMEVSGTIGRITGMDPARPGTLGFIRSIGHADFYPNGGTFRQPGCPVFSAQYCSHARAHDFMGESIINPLTFGAVQCNSWIEFKAAKCRDNSTIVFMGENVSRNARGSFFLETNPQPPFGKNEI